MTAYDVAIEAGNILLENGAEVFRVKETMEHILKAYDFSDADIFVLTNAIFISGRDEEQSGKTAENGSHRFSTVRQIPVGQSCLNRVVAVNQLSREISEGKYTPEEAYGKLQKIRNIKEYGMTTQILAAGLSAAAFAGIFGGGVGDIIASFPIGILIGLFLLTVGKRMSKIMSNILGGIIITVLAICFYQAGRLAGIDLSISNMTIGAVMPLVPGIAFVNSIRDLAAEDYISGIVRMTYAILGFVAIALGAGGCLALYIELTGGMGL